MTGNPGTGGSVSQRTLIAYQTSKTGVTRENANIIAGVLRDEFDHQVDVVDLKADKVPDLARYENVVVGAGIKIGRPYRRPKKLLKDKRLVGKRVAIFISSGMAGDDPEGATAKYERRVCTEWERIRPVACQAFGGRMDFGEETDFRDPEKVREWAHRLGEILKHPGT